jgi:hypothetical protein
MGSFFDTDKELEDFYFLNKRDGLQTSFIFTKVTEEEVKSAMNEITSRSDVIR